MKSLLDFLSSQQAVIFYIVVFLAIFLCIIIYLVEKNNVRLRQKHNTRELNKLVNQIKEDTTSVEDAFLYEKPVLEQLIATEENVIVPDNLTSDNDKSSVEDFKKELYEQLDVDEELANESVNVSIDSNQSDEKASVESFSLDEYSDKETVNMENVVAEEQLENKKEEENSSNVLQYTNCEPTIEEAQLELKKFTEELKQQSEIQPENIKLTNYEEQQEENAIISLEELVLKSKSLYEANELAQYADDGKEPISLQELEAKVGERAAKYDEPFIIEDVVSCDDVLDDQAPASLKQEKNIVADNNSNNGKFKNSPIISPIYGIEEENVNETDMELENTANYEKLDAEIKRTTEFLMTLKELQKRLD